MSDDALLERPGQKAIKSAQTESLPRYLSVRQLAELLHINEKKVYQLAGEGDIPCTKITGKWLFPTQLIENWIFENSHGGVMTDRMIIAGSEDVLMQRVCNRVAIELQDHAMISYSPCGTRHGLRMLETGRIDVCAIHWGASEKNALRHLGLLRTYRNHRNWVVARVLLRTQGLVVANSMATTECTIDSLLEDEQLRWAMRRDVAGSTRILQDLCNARHRSIDQLNHTVLTESERSAVTAVSTGHADIACCAQSVAKEHNLPFVPIATVAVDLVMSRQTYFRTLLQECLKHFRTEETQQDAKMLGGYELFDEIELITV